MIHLAVIPALSLLHAAAVGLRGARAGIKVVDFLDSGDPFDLLAAARVVIAPCHGDMADVMDHVFDLFGLKDGHRS